MFSFWKKSKKAGSAKAGAKAQPATTPVPQAGASEQTTTRQNTKREMKYDILAVVQTDVGCKRDSNEDYGRYFRPSDPETLSAKGVLLIVADGMGGHSAGEVASRLAVEVINRVYYDANESAGAALLKAFHEANDNIYQASSNDENLRGMGTTCTALVLQNGSALCGHVGDSRLYLIRGDDIYLMTEDHSEAGEMIKQGLLSIEDARSYADRNVILRALGSRPHVDVAMWEKPLSVKSGDCFLLCSDGLYDLVRDREIKEALAKTDLHDACESLIALAKKRGGHDNITVAIARLLDHGAHESRAVRATRDITLPLQSVEANV